MAPEEKCVKKNEPSGASAVDGDVDVAAATADHLRQMGVSFIRREDLERAHGVLAGRGGGGYRDDSLPSLAPSVNTEESMAVNSLALKYLDDNMLSLLATASAEKRGPRRQPAAGLTKFGLSDVSLATAEFLRQNRLVTSIGGGSGGNKRQTPSGATDDEEIIDFDELQRKPKFE